MDITRLASLRPRFVWDILDDAFDLYRERFVVLTGIAFVSSIPATLARILLTRSDILHPNRDASDALGIQFQHALIEMPFWTMATFFGTAATAVVVRNCLDGRPATIASAFREVIRRFWPLLFACLIVTVMQTLGLALLVAGALLAYLYASFVAPVVVLENRGPWAAWRRSRELVGPDFARVLGVVCLMSLILAGIWASLASVLAVIYSVMPQTGDVAAHEAQRTIANAASTTLSGILLRPLPAVAITLLYFDIIVRRSGPDLVALAQETGVTLAPDPFGDISSARVARQQSKERKRSRKAGASHQGTGGHE